MKFKKLLFIIPVFGLFGCGKKPVETDIACRFVVCSDTHISAVDDENQIGIQRIKKMFKQSFDYAGSQLYNKIDHVFVVGDGADDASRESQTLYNNTVNEMKKQYGVGVTTVLGNHEFSWTLASYEDIVEDYKSVTGATSLDYHFKIGDFHFIAMSPRNKSWQYVEQESAPWLEEQLKQAAKDDPSGSKPIFVFQHIGIKNTCYGTDVDYQTYTDDDGITHDAVLMPAVLEKYPQVIHFSAHSHRPISDPRMIMQDKYTTITTGSLSYYDMDIPNLYTNHVFAQPDGSYIWSIFNDFQDLDASQFLIVEVKKNGAVKVMPYCVDGNHFLEDSYFIDPFTSTSNFKYTIARKDTDPLPVFDYDPIKTKIVHSNSVALDVYQALYAQNYRCELYKGEELIETEYRIANVQMPTQPESFKVSFDDLDADTSYKIKITPVNSWGKEGLNPVTFEFKTYPAE